MTRSPLKELVVKLNEAKELNLIADVTTYNTCEINSYIVIVFHRSTTDETKHRLLEHIKVQYDDVLYTHFSAMKTRLFIEYDDWENLPRHVAF
jgi:hypothetical protein